MTADTKNFDGSTASIRAIFEAAASEKVKERAEYACTLNMMREQILKLQNAGITNIGMDVADFDMLQAYQMLPTNGSDVFAILSVYDARFIARINPDHTVTLHTKNINKLHTNISEVEGESNIAKKLAKLHMTVRLLDDNDIFAANKKNQSTLTCDLTDRQSTNELLIALTEIAAACEANYNLRKGNIAPHTVLGIK